MEEEGESVMSPNSAAAARAARLAAAVRRHPLGPEWVEAEEIGGLRALFPKGGAGDPGAAAALAAAIVSGARLSRLLCEAVDLPDEVAHAIGARVASGDGRGGLSYLSLSHAAFTPAGWAAVAVGLRDAAAPPEVICLGDTALPQGIADALGVALPRRRTRRLFLGRAELPPNAPATLAAGIAGSALEELSVAYARVADGGLGSLDPVADAAAGCRTLTGRVYCAGAPVGAAAAARLRVAVAARGGSVTGC